MRAKIPFVVQIAQQQVQVYMNISDFFDSNGWTVAGNLTIPPRESRTYTVDDIPLARECHRFLNSPPYSGQVYLHQKETIQHFIEGRHVCITTGTALGKSLAFQVAALQELAQNSFSRIVAIYPMKALGNEQTKRWKQVLTSAGIKAQVGRIDGSVKGRKRRLNILQNSRVLVFTPDIIHAWLFSNLANPIVREFLSHISLIIVDEVHTYTGVFGSNSAFLFRRMRHLMRLLSAEPKFICASATISEPGNHLQKLFGLNFILIDQNHDTSPKHKLDLQLVEPPAGSNFLTNITQLLAHITSATSNRFITFVDSRVQVEHISSILARENPNEEGYSDENGTSNLIDSLQVLPYRAGYEAKDRNEIQRRLSEEDLRGVISTSALELGIDIPGLDLCVLVGVPNSQTSLHQRIGRIGRHGEGHVIIINSGAVYDQAVFANPSELLNSPPIESALYLENKYIQYIHALCLARHDGEHDQIALNVSVDLTNKFDSPIAWPEGFVELCTKERLGEIPKELQSMKSESSDSPNYTYPLRDVESQFTIEYKRGLETEKLGSLSYSQLMREAYPGAVYYHLTQAYRVYQVYTRSKLVKAREEKKYTTKPQRMPVQIFPNLTRENTFGSYKFDKLTIIECDLQVRESLSGFKERRGPNENIHSYPLETGIVFDMQYFTRNYFTTGVIITHPSLKGDAVNCNALAELIFEAFLMLIPFERQDINFAVDKHRSRRQPIIGENDKFIAIYDQTYGSLRLSGRFVEPPNVERVLEKARQIADEQEALGINAETLFALDAIITSAKESTPSALRFGVDTSIIESTADSLVRIIMPGSKGLNLERDNEEFLVERIFYTPNGVRYSGPSYNDSTAKTNPFIESIIEIPGESRIGYYNLETGEITETTPTISVQTEAITTETTKAPVETRKVDVNKLRIVLLHYFEATHVRQLAHSFGIDQTALLNVQDKTELVRILVAHCENENQSMQLLKATRNLYEMLRRQIQE